MRRLTLPRGVDGAGIGELSLADGLVDGGARWRNRQQERIAALVDGVAFERGPRRRGRVLIKFLVWRMLGSRLRSEGDGWRTGCGLVGPRTKRTRGVVRNQWLSDARRSSDHRFAGASASIGRFAPPAICPRFAAAAVHPRRAAPGPARHFASSRRSPSLRRRPSRRPHQPPPPVGRRGAGIPRVAWTIETIG